MIIIVIIEKQTMKRIFRTKMMMTATVLLLMAAMSGRQRLAAQEAGVQDPDVEQADGKQGGVMQLTRARTGSSGPTRRSGCRS